MQPANPWLHRYAQFLVAYTMLLILIGAMVTTLDAGLAVPDWPTTFGYNMFTYPIGLWKGYVFWEHSHRVVASILGALVIALTIWVAKAEPRKWVRVLAWAALVLVCLQGLMGGLRVTRLSIKWAIIHGCTAQMFFCLLVLIAAVLSPRWEKPVAKGISAARLGSIRVWAWLVTAAIYVQLILGAVVRHRKAGLAIPTFPFNPDGTFFPRVNEPLIHLHFAHRFWAIIVTATVLVLAYKIIRYAAAESRLLRPAVALVIMIALQITLGVMAVLYLRASIPTSAHVINGAAILAISFMLSVRSAQFSLLLEGEHHHIQGKGAIA